MQRPRSRTLPEHVQGSIYDLGYRRYEGLRLGRRAAVISLYLYSLRTAFGLGRRTTAKIMPFGLTALALIPAIIQLGVAAIIDEEFDLFEAKDYYGYVQVMLALFAAAAAPELVGRDQRNHTLPLYFSRAVSRSDYTIAKFLALTTAMFAMTLLPQLVLYVGKGFAGSDIDGYFRDNWEEFPQILASGVAISALVALIGLPIAAQTPRRAYSTGAILGFFVVSWTAAGILSDISHGPGTGVSLFFAPFWVIRGLTLWFFNADAGEFSPLTYADIPMFMYALVTLVYIAVGGLLFLRRMEKVAA
jgi:ABC-2 type transport system permease protein